ncbi:VWA domain-containing protein [Halopenitus sp. POP-27]|uniref:VWA domain-containing protein n=1 Tax=Halopenitus sp. POP-27 TaxID=2994425 RepID=UPI0024691D86|nr:VWA domain-containing protein [Halopenitus sp. POP-27]
MVELGSDKKASHDRGAERSRRSEQERGRGDARERGRGSDRERDREVARGREREGALPFGAIVGQDDLKRGLLAVAANDDLDGLLIRGAKGTAKSTAVRGLAGLLPTQTVVEGCPYGCPPDDPGRQCADCRSRPAAEIETTERPVPVVTLPLSATRERVVGTLSVADALAGEYEFDPGVLARANRGILYVDEVNLLGDHLVDTLLDAAASGVNRVERDGVSVTHPASFTLVGTMNPEEGDLRPQLRDRFALQTTVTGCDSIDDRVAIIDRALGDDGEERGREDGQGEANANDPDTDAYRERLRRARRRLPDVTLPRSFREEIAELCRDAGVEGHRGDIATARAARTFAALEDRGRVLESDVREAASFALAHRLRSDPFDSAPEPEDRIDEHFASDGDGDVPEDTEGATSEDEDGRRNGGATPNATAGDPEGADGADAEPADGVERDADTEAGSEVDRDAPGRGSDPEPAGEHADDEGDTDEDDVNEGAMNEGGANEGETDGDDANGDDATDGDAIDGDANNSDREERTPIVPGQSRASVGRSRAPEISVPDAKDAGPDAHDAADLRSGSGTRPSAEGDVAGPRVRSERADTTAASADVDVGASLRAATRRGASSIESRDLRRSVRRGDADTLVTFVVDASASMRPAMRAAKGVVLELLRDAYEGREEVAFVAFAGTDADVLLPPTDSVGMAARHLKDLPTGDRTPLPAGLRTAATVVRRADPAAGVVVVVTDGRANVADGSPSAETRAAGRELAETGAHVVVVDAGAEPENGGSGHGDPGRGDPGYDGAEKPSGSDRGGGSRRSDRNRSSLIGPLLRTTGGERIPLSALSADRIDGQVARVDRD